MNELLISLFRSLVAIFVFAMMGVGLRRLSVVGKSGSDFLSRAVVYVFFPVLVFYKIAMTEDPHTIFADLTVHLWAVILLFGSGLLAFLWSLFAGRSESPRTFIFAAAMPNWIYLPLAIAGPLWGDEAVRLLILFNIPTQFILWTAGIWLLRGRMKGAHVIRFLLLNPGLLATVAGILTAYGFLPLTLREGGQGISLAFAVPFLHVIGGLTIPLSIVVLGLYLGERFERRPGARREVVSAVLCRMILAPLLLGALILLTAAAGIPTPQMTRWILYLIIAMPVAMSVPLFVQLFGGDHYLASRAVVVSSGVGLVTAPLFVAGMIKLELLLGIAATVAAP